MASYRYRNKTVSDKEENPMTRKIVISQFETESEAYQALSQFRRSPLSEDYSIRRAAIVRKSGDTLNIADGFSIADRSAGHMWTGWMIGLIAGMFFGFGIMLICGMAGSLIGMHMDSQKLKKESRLLQAAAADLADDRTAVLMLVNEVNEEAVNDRLARFDTDIRRINADELQAELEQSEKQKKQQTAA